MVRPYITDAIASYNNMIREIEKIALQVNMISINASIEAARLGVSGKAFGVIADEIRNLAKATQETMTENNAVFSSAETTMGEMGEMIKQIMDIVTAAHKNVQEINNANNATSAGLPGLESEGLHVGRLSQVN